MRKMIVRADRSPGARNSPVATRIAASTATITSVRTNVATSALTFSTPILAKIAVSAANVAESSAKSGARGAEDTLEHRPCKLSGERILLAWMVRAEQRDAVEAGARAVAEARSRLRYDAAVFRVRFQKLVECDLPERDDNSNAAQQLKLADEIRTAAVEFRRQRLVVRWRAARGRGNIAVRELQAVVFVQRSGQAGE